MGKKECFGTVKEVVLQTGFTMTQTRPECRNCEDFRDCLRYSKQTIEERDGRSAVEAERERDELKKQELITQIIDLSQVLSNEIGSCLLEFLNRTYTSPLGTVLFKSVLLFYELPRDTMSHTITITISPSTLDLIQVGEVKLGHPSDLKGDSSRKGTRESIPVRIVLLQRSFSNNRKANMGLIAYEVAHLFASDSLGISQLLEVLPESEGNSFKKMNDEERTGWLMEKWGFLEELKAFKKEIALLKGKKGD